MVDPMRVAIENMTIATSRSPGNVGLGFAIRPLDLPALKGSLLDRSKARKSGFKKRSIKNTETWEYCFKSAYECDHKIVISVLVQVDKDGVITNTSSEVHRVYITMMGEGKSENLGNDLFPDDLDKAEEAIRAVLGDGATPRPGNECATGDPSSVSVEALQLLIGENAGSPQVKELLDRFCLRRSPAIMGAGSSYTRDGCRIEVQTGGMGFVETIFLNPAPQDHWSDGLKAGAHHDELIARLGAPTKTSPEMGWDRFDSSEVAIHITYHRQTGVVAKITLMDPSTAP